MTRILLVPSVTQEASARVVAEALVNGIPVIASERGGLPENCGRGGFIIPLPDSVTTKSIHPVDALTVRPWIDIILSLYQNPNAYKRASFRAYVEGRRYLPETVASLYVRYFWSVLDSSTETRWKRRCKCKLS